MYIAKLLVIFLSLTSFAYTVIGRIWHNRPSVMQQRLDLPNGNAGPLVPVRPGQMLNRSDEQTDPV